MGRQCKPVEIGATDQWFDGCGGDDASMSHPGRGVVAMSGWIGVQEFHGNPDKGEAAYKAQCGRRRDATDGFPLSIAWT